MKFKFFTIAALSSLSMLTSCSNDDNNNGQSTQPVTVDRWITVAGAIMGSTDPIPGDGNGGTIVYSISKKDAKDASKTFNVFENGFLVPSNRTARLQSSQHGSTLFSITY